MALKRRKNEFRKSLTDLQFNGKVPTRHTHSFQNLKAFKYLATICLLLSIDMANAQTSSNPTFTPTVKKSQEPSFLPSLKITQNPTVKLTLNPTALPTPEPTLTPTTKASSKPTLNPTALPTPEPTLTPTIKASSKPSVSPSIELSNSPSAMNSESPSSIPTAKPTKNPSKMPSAKPSLTASDSPSKSPSLNPSLHPSILPTILSSGLPTSQPTLLSSVTPTDTPSQIPSASSIPTTLPSSLPTKTPSMTPTTTPTSEPSIVPSSIPTIFPTSFPTIPLQIESVDGNIYFDDCPRLTMANTEIWQNVTRDYIVDEINTLNLDFMDLEVEVQLEEQCESRSDCTRELELPEMEQDTCPLSLANRILFFNVTVSFRSATDTHNVSTYVAGAFGASKNDQYIRDLQARKPDAFGPINCMRVGIEGQTPEDDDDEEEEGLSRTTIYIISGTCAGGVLVLGVIILVCIIKRKKRKKKEEEDARLGQEVTSFINVVPQGLDDVSTIGDPIYPAGMTFSPQLPSENDSYSGTYDYANMYGGTGEMYSASSAGASTNVTGSRKSFPSSRSVGSHQQDTASYYSNSIRSNDLFSDDTSFEKQYIDDEERIEVRAPPGKLGMVIDTPNGGMPIVHAIRDNSTLVDKIRIGDKLISVDGEDTTNMTALRVSKLISNKAANPTRVLVFTRSKQGGR